MSKVPPALFIEPVAGKERSKIPDFERAYEGKDTRNQNISEPVTLECYARHGWYAQHSTLDQTRTR